MSCIRYRGGVGGAQASYFASFKTALQLNICMFCNELVAQLYCIAFNEITHDYTNTANARFILHFPECTPHNSSVKVFCEFKIVEHSTFVVTQFYRLLCCCCRFFLKQMDKELHCNTGINIYLTPERCNNMVAETRCGVFATGFDTEKYFSLLYHTRPCALRLF